MIARKRQGVTSAMSVKAGHGGGGGRGGGRTGGGGGGHEPDRAAADVLDLEEFFGVVPFDGPRPTLGELLAMDEPLSAAAVAANELWLRTPHPEHFFKDTDLIGSAAAELVDRTDSASESDGRRLRRSSGSSCRTSSSNNSTRNASGGLGKENAGVENGTRTRPMKRPREDAGVLASTCSSAANKRGKSTISAPKATQDPRKKQLLEFKQKKRVGMVAGAPINNSTADRQSVSGSGRGPSSRSAVSRPSVSRTSVSLRRNDASRIGASNRDVCGSAVTLRGATSATSTIVTKPVTMVKRRVGGAAGAGAKKCPNRAGAGGLRGGTEAGAARGAQGGRSGSTGGVERGGHDRKRHLAKGGREPAQKGGDSTGSALSFDDVLKAKLEAHNKVVNKGKHTYEPAASVRDCRMWEKQTGKKYGSLSYDERADANKEIDEMRARAKESQQGRS